MYRLYGFYSQHSMKTLYVLQELGVEFEFRFVNLMQREQHGEAFRRMTPVGKVPLLEHDGRFLFESGAICRYLAQIEKSPLYPADAWERGQVDQWLDFFTCHLGLHLNTLFFQRLVKPALGLGDPDAGRCEEATGFARQQFGLVDQALGGGAGFLANGRLSIADLCAFAYVEQVRQIDFALDVFPNVQGWFDPLDSRESIARARAQVAPYRQAH